MEFVNSEDKIKIEGPPEESEKAREQLDAQAKELVGRMSFAELSVDAKYHKHIIGKGGSTGEREQFRRFLFNKDLMKFSCASSDQTLARICASAATLESVLDS